jgi:L-fuculose-phosphate aldolase
MSERQIRQQIVQVGKLLYEKGFICASDGNISVRLSPNRILITPSGLHKGLLEPDHILLIDANGDVIRGARGLKPTSELPMHLEAFRQRDDISAVVHAHPPISVALSIAGISMTDCLLPEVIVFLGIIPTTAYATPSSEENVRAIRDLITHHDGLILQRHGSLTVGNDVMQAFMRTETIEQNARIGFMLQQLGVHNPLPPHEVRKLLAQREKMGLTRPGDAEKFCEECGVCHTTSDHAPALRPRSIGITNQVTPDLDPQAIQALVAQTVKTTLGNK